MLLSCGQQTDIAFEEASWKSHPVERHRMRNDLVRSERLRHQTTGQVLLLLGEPEIRSDSLSRWRYEAGYTQRGFGVRFYHLFLQFRNNRVDSALVDIQDDCSIPDRRLPHSPMPARPGRNG